MLPVAPERLLQAEIVRPASNELRAHNYLMFGVKPSGDLSKAQSFMTPTSKLRAELTSENSIDQRIDRLRRHVTHYLPRSESGQPRPVSVLDLLTHDMPYSVAWTPPLEIALISEGA